jgi:hypothetical protein
VPCVSLFHILNWRQSESFSCVFQLLSAVKVQYDSLEIFVTILKLRILEEILTWTNCYTEYG